MQSRQETPNQTSPLTFLKEAVKTFPEIPFTLLAPWADQSKTALGMAVHLLPDAIGLTLGRLIGEFVSRRANFTRAHKLFFTAQIESDLALIADRFVYQEIIGQQIDNFPAMIGLINMTVDEALGLVANRVFDNRYSIAPYLLRELVAGSVAIASFSAALEYAKSGDFHTSGLLVISNVTNLCEIFASAPPYEEVLTASLKNAIGRQTSTHNKTNASIREQIINAKTSNTQASKIAHLQKSLADSQKSLRQWETILEEIQDADYQEILEVLKEHNLPTKALYLKAQAVAFAISGPRSLIDHISSKFSRTSQQRRTSASAPLSRSNQPLSKPTRPAHSPEQPFARPTRPSPDLPTRSSPADWNTQDILSAFTKRNPNLSPNLKMQMGDALTSALRQDQQMFSKLSLAQLIANERSQTRQMLDQMCEDKMIGVTINQLLSSFAQPEQSDSPRASRLGYRRETYTDNDLPSSSNPFSRNQATPTNEPPPTRQSQPPHRQPIDRQAVQNAIDEMLSSTETNSQEQTPNEEQLYQQTIEAITSALEKTGNRPVNMYLPSIRDCLMQDLDNHALGCTIPQIPLHPQSATRRNLAAIVNANDANWDNFVTAYKSLSSAK